MGILCLYCVHCLLVRQNKTVGASLPNAKMQFCCNGLTLSERKFSTSTRNQIIFNKKALHERFHSIVLGWYLNSEYNIYQRIRRIIALSNQNALILKCVDSINSKRSFKSINYYIIGS